MLLKMADLESSLFSSASVMSKEDSYRPILSKELKVDKKLIFSCAKNDFRKIVADSIESITAHEEKLAKLSDLMQRPVSFPNNYVFATISKRVYKVEKLYKSENGHDSHGQVAYPKIGNWRLLTVGLDPRLPSVNGYCGAAYWNPDTQQVIIAHCGTKNMGGLYSDFYGVFRNEHVPQIDSAVTFTDEIVSALKDVNNEKGSNIQLFFTGHSLGAWLSCITAFSAKFLRRSEDGCFVSNVESEDSGYHSSTVVFDGPGCKEMLERIQNRTVDRYGPSYIASLDITNYLSAPHFINTCNHQVGDVYRLCVDLAGHKEELESLKKENVFQNLVEMNIVVHTLAMHRMKNIISVFNPQTGDVLEDNGILRIRRVKDWPQLVPSAKKEDIKNKLKRGGKKILKVAAKFAVEVIGLMDLSGLTGGILFRSAYSLIQGTSDLHKLKKWYKDLIHELKSFLNAANESNNYEPERVFSSETEYREIRYKIEYLNTNYKNSHKQTVFKYNELQFLEEYKILEEFDNHLPVIVSLKEVFNSFKDNKMLQISVIEMLKGCKIKNEFIHSRSVKEHIVYIKHLLHFFPEIQQKVSLAHRCLPEDIPKKYHELLSEKYLASVGNRFEDNVDLVKDTIGLKAFLNDSTKRILHVTGSCTKFEALRTYKTLKMICMECQDYECQHIFFNLHQTFFLVGDAFINYLRNIVPKYVICIECDDIFHNTVEKLLGELFELVQDNHTGKETPLKIILLTKKNSDISRFMSCCFFNNLSNYQKIDTEIFFEDLTLDSQEKLLEKTVLFQGRKVPFCIVLNGCSSPNTIIDPETIVDLSQNKLIEIGKILPTLGAAENYYIERKLVQKVKVRNQILSNEMLSSTNTLVAVSKTCDEDISRLVVCENKKARFVGEKGDTARIVILAESHEESDFKALCDEYPDCNIHWLVKNADNLFWKKSHGKCLDVLRKHIEDYECDLTEDAYSVENSSIKLVDFDDINGFEGKIIVIAAGPGMGKTTAFTHLETVWFTDSNKVSQWLVRINLLDYKNELKEKQFKSAVDIINFFFENNVSQLTKKLLQSRLVESGDIVFLLDGFDELSSESQESIVDLLKLLQDTKAEKVFVSTRLHLRDVLENKFTTLAYTFKPFFRRDQEEFLQKFWKKDVHTGIDEEFMQSFLGRLLDCISKSMGDKEREFMGIPLQMRMIAESFRYVVTSETFMKDPMYSFPKNFNILQLYNRFISVKYREFFKKIGAGTIDLDSDVEEDWFTRSITKVHGVVALKALFPEVSKDFNCDKCLSEKDKKRINKIGIVQITNDEPAFINKTFAEYYVANFLARRLSKKETSEKYKTALKFLDKEFFEKKNEVIKTFLDYHLAKDDLLVALLDGKLTDFRKMLSDDPQRIGTVDDLGRNFMHYAAQGNHHQVVDLLQGFTNIDLGMQDYLGKTPLHYATNYLSKEFIVNSFFYLRDCMIVKDNNGHMPFAYFRDVLEFLSIKQKLFSLSQDVWGDGIIS